MKDETLVKNICEGVGKDGGEMVVKIVLRMVMRLND